MFFRLLKGALKETCSVCPHLWTSISQGTSRTHVTTVALRYEKRDLLIQWPDYIIESLTFVTRRQCKFKRVIS